MILTQILLPEDLNSTVMAEILDPDLTALAEATRQAEIDRMQYLLDGLFSRGILG